MDSDWELSDGLPRCFTHAEWLEMEDAQCEHVKVIESQRWWENIPRFRSRMTVSVISEWPSYYSVPALLCRVCLLGADKYHHHHHHHEVYCRGGRAHVHPNIIHRYVHRNTHTGPGVEKTDCPLHSPSVIPTHLEKRQKNIQLYQASFFGTVRWPKKKHNKCRLPCKNDVSCRSAVLCFKKNTASFSEFWLHEPAGWDLSFVGELVKEKLSASIAAVLPWLLDVVQVVCHGFGTLPVHL